MIVTLKTFKKMLKFVMYDTSVRKSDLQLKYLSSFLNYKTFTYAMTQCLKQLHWSINFIEYHNEWNMTRVNQ